MHVNVRSLAASQLSRTGSKLHPIQGLPCAAEKQAALFSHPQQFQARSREQAGPLAQPRDSAGFGLRSLSPAREGRVATRQRSEDTDAAHWNHSPEWWGTQDGGWGRNAGTTVFRQQTQHGNGEVVVTAHPAASAARDGRAHIGSEQWRVLRFNSVTRQSVNRVRLRHNGQGQEAVEAWPDCLAFPYLRTMASSGAAFLGFSDLTYSAVSTNGSGRTQPRALCIGMGGGTLPMFLAHQFPGLAVEVAELDPVVIAAATDAMGFPTSRSNLHVQTGDAAAYVAERVRQGAQPLDAVFLDAFDGDDNVPPSLCSPGSPLPKPAVRGRQDGAGSAFMGDLAAALHPRHGTLVMNLHGGGPPAPSLTAWVAGLLGRTAGTAQQERRRAGYDLDSVEGRAIQRIGAGFRDALLGPADRDDRPGGIAYTVSVPHQHNVVLVVSRAVQPGRASGLQHYETAERLRGAGAAAAATAGFPFDAEPLVARDYMPLTRRL